MPKIIDGFLGIDPGKSGGIALLVPSGRIQHATSMPDTEADILEFLKTSSAGTTACIEQVSGFIGKEQPGSAMFNFGMGYGGLRMALLACKIPFEVVAPRTWQKALGIPPKKKTESKTQWKNRLKAKAQQLFPRLKVTLATADALLIAEYCYRKHRGAL